MSLIGAYIDKHNDQPIRSYGSRKPSIFWKRSSALARPWIIGNLLDAYTSQYKKVISILPIERNIAATRHLNSPSLETRKDGQIFSGNYWETLLNTQNRNPERIIETGSVRTQAISRLRTVPHWRPE